MKILKYVIFSLCFGSFVNAQKGDSFAQNDISNANTLVVDKRNNSTEQMNSKEYCKQLKMASWSKRSHYHRRLGDWIGGT